MHGRGDAEFASAKSICRIRQFNSSIGVAINNLYFVGTRKQVYIACFFVYRIGGIYEKHR